MSLSALSYTKTIMDSFQPTSVHNRLSIGHALMASGVFLFLCLSLLLSAVSSISAAAFGTSIIGELSNNVRNSNGIASLTVNSKLTTAAQNKANAMVANNYFEHTAPDGTTGWDYVSSAGYGYLYVGENLAASNEDDSSVVNGWLNSPGHRANLLNSTYTDVGYGVAYIGDYLGYGNVTFIVALYAKPQPSPVVASPAPPAPVTAPQATVSAAPVPVATDTAQPEDAVESTVQETETTEPQKLDTSSLSKNRFSMNRQLSFGLLTLGTTLSISGMAIETRRFLRHPRHWRL